MIIALYLLTLHFIADFIFQTDWMALNKSKRWDALTFHVCVYTLVFFVGLSIWRWIEPLSFRAQLIFLNTTFIAHFVTDAITSRWTSRLWFINLIERPKQDIFRDWPLEGKSHYGAYPLFAAIVPGNRHWFFVVIGFDQLLHAYQLLLTWQFVSHL